MQLLSFVYVNVMGSKYLLINYISLQRLMCKRLKNILIFLVWSLKHFTTFLSQMLILHQIKLNGLSNIILYICNNDELLFKNILLGKRNKIYILYILLNLGHSLRINSIFRWSNVTFNNNVFAKIVLRSYALFRETILMIYASYCISSSIFLVQLYSTNREMRF